MLVFLGPGSNALDENTGILIMIASRDAIHINDGLHSGVRACCAGAGIQVGLKGAYAARKARQYGVAGRLFGAI